MNIIISGKKAVLKKGFSFDYTIENPLFRGREGYTLALTFPLRGCKENLAIFGHINRADAVKTRTHLPANIDAGRVQIAGMVYVVSITEAEVQCQFVQGRCAQTSADPFEKIFINELDLDRHEPVDLSIFTPLEAWNGEMSTVAIALPFINTNSPTAPNNEVIRHYGGNEVSYTWHPENKGLSWMPYLVRLAEMIGHAVGYTCDFSKWRTSRFCNLVCCNAIPATWGLNGYADPLPRWTVTEFFEKLELLLGAEFTLDHLAQTISMRFSKDVVLAEKEVKLSEVVDAYTSTVNDEKDATCDYLPSKGLAYADNGGPLWKYHYCEWLPGAQPPFKSYPTLRALLDANKQRFIYSENGDDIEAVEWGETLEDGSSTTNARLYAQDVDTSFAMRIAGEDVYNAGALTAPHYFLEPLNIFGYDQGPDIDNRVSMDFVPAPVGDTFVSSADSIGPRLYLSPSTDNRQSETTAKTKLMLQIEAGKTEKQAFYDKIYVGYWNEGRKLPYPVTDRMQIAETWTDALPHNNESLRPADILEGLPQIYPNIKYSFSWIGDTIPSPRAIFHIQGKKYVCEKVTATFNEKGMSQLLKGDFYEVIE